jgi:GDP-L-fucose synthase
MSDNLTLRDFYSGKKVIVCGGAGFIGAVLSEHLLSIGAHVTVLDNGSRGTRRPHGADFISASITPEICRQLFDGAFAVFNLAAKVAGVLYNVNHHHAMYYDNIKLLMEPLMAAEVTAVPHYLQTSSVCVYSPSYNHPSIEINGLLGTPHTANAGYAEAKRDGERAVLWSKLAHAVIVRPSNVFGPFDYFDDKAHVIPALIKRAARENPLLLHGDPMAVREFIYVDDVAKGMMIALARGEHKEAYNIGCGGRNSTTIKGLAGLICEIYGFDREIIGAGGDGGDSIRFSDSSRLERLGWKHKVSLQDGLKRTIRWWVKQVYSEEDPV